MPMLGVSVQEKTGGVYARGRLNGGDGRMSNTQMYEAALLKSFIYSITITKDRITE